MAEAPEARHKRLTLRSMRRGTREMDLILGPFAAAELAGMTPAELDLYEVLLDQSDPELYAWISGRPGDPSSGPPGLHPMLDRIAAFARSRWTPGTA